jgi:hypothetical protein
MLILLLGFDQGQNKGRVNQAAARGAKTSLE